MTWSGGSWDYDYNDEVFEYDMVNMGVEGSWGVLGLCCCCMECSRTKGDTYSNSTQKIEEEFQET